MTSLDDLVRATLAERAHDVDGLVLAPAPVARPARPWVALGAVGVLAAAILTVVVLVTPWGGPSTRDATPAGPPSPPAGMQWVSYHGITLTVPDSWEVGPPSGCGPPSVDAVSVAGPLVAAPSCPAPMRQVGQTTTQVFLQSLDGGSGGDPVTVGGRPAYRSSATADAWQAYATWPVEARVDLPEVSVELLVATTSEQRVQQVLDAVEYLPVDHLGCAAQASYVGPSSLLDTRVNVPASGPVAVCEYAPTDIFRAPLVGSRLLQPAEADALRTTVSSSPTPGGGAGGPLAPIPGLLLYRFTGPSGVTIIAAVRNTGSVEFGAGDDKSHAVDGADVPTAYPTR